MGAQQAERHKANVMSITESIRELAKDDPDMVPELASILAKWARKQLYDSLPGKYREDSLESVVDSILEGYTTFLLKREARARAALAATGAAAVARQTARGTRVKKKSSQ